MPSVSFKHKGDTKVLLQRLASRGFRISDGKQHIVFTAKISDVTCTVYKTGTVLLQGPYEELLTQIAEDIAEIKLSPKSISAEPSITTPYVGVDESGKGDVFGGLVSAAVLVSSQEDAALLLSFGVQDSKKINDKKIPDIATKILEAMVCTINILSPEEYNAEYSKYKNLNLLLGALHARSITEIMQTTFCAHIYVDKFGDQSNISQFLHDNLQPQLSCITKGEDKAIGIAAASVLARYAFLAQLQDMSHVYKMNIPKGAGPTTRPAVIDINKRFGLQMFQKVSKLHFSNIAKFIES